MNLLRLSHLRAYELILFVRTQVTNIPFVLTVNVSSVRQTRSQSVDSYLKGYWALNLSLENIFGRLGGVVVSVLATGPKGCGFKTRARRWIFKGDKNPQHTFLSVGK
jgi:hypothetical protein